ncbi:MAG TPA: hypothetical protein VIG06_00240 [Kofleriaceae bacterium]|jgi:hypothetical protein
MLKFRETLWFKKGELDSHEAARAAEGDDDLAPGAVDLLPREDRYRDDGSLTRTDSHSFGVRTGKTSFLTALPDASIGAAVAQYAEHNMVQDMKRGAALRLVVIGAGLLALAAVLATLA